MGNFDDNPFDDGDPFAEFQNPFNVDSYQRLYDDPFEQRVKRRKGPPLGPYSKQGPWSGNNQLGYELQYAPNDNNRRTVLKLDEWGMPEVWSLMLGLEISDESTTQTAEFDITAEINAGVGGATQKVLCTWRTGTVIAMPMNAVNVIAIYDGPIGGPVSFPEDLFLRVTVARGCARGIAPVYTSGLQTAPAGSLSPIFRIPPFATHIMAVPELAGDDANIYAATNFVFQLGTSGGLGTGATINASRMLSWGPAGLPIAQKAKYVRYQNAGGSDVDFRWVFNLGL